MRKHEKKPGTKCSISIRSRIIIISSACIMVFALAVGSVYLVNWMALAQETAEIMSYDMNEKIKEQVDNLITEPYKINEVNQKLISNGIIDLTDEKVREKFFVSVLQSCGSQIYAFTYGMESGEYYGARRNKPGEIKIIKDDGDSRTKEWYLRAKRLGKPTYVPGFRNFNVEDLAVSAAWPVYNDKGELEGVLATHMLLTGINQYLKEAVSQKEGYAYIINKDSEELIGNSFDQANYTILKDGTLKRYKLSEVGSAGILRDYEQYKKSRESHYQSQGDPDYYINVTEYHTEGLDWIIVSAASNHSFMDKVFSNLQGTVLIMATLLVMSIFVYYVSTGRMIKPIKDLITAMEQLSSGDLTKRVEVKRNDELGTIANIFNQMADRMNELVNHLEDNVQERTSQIQYLSRHDTLTGLLNRHSFEDTLKKYDTKAYLPISIIFADVNGLKMINDVFGHSSGDMLIKKIADILKKSCRSEDAVARVGGDEFIILLPNTEEKEVIMVVERIKAGLSGEKVNDIQCSIAIGYDTKTSAYEDVEKIIGNAENEMYQDKAISRKRFADDAINTIIHSLQGKSRLEKVHSNHVAGLCERMGKALGLPQPEVKKLYDAGYLHDIGKIVIENTLLNKQGGFTQYEQQELRQHTVTGYKILKLFDHTLDLADDVYAHHERWDGSGYPKGLKGQEIPLNARIIALAESYDNKLSRLKEVTAGGILQILEEMQEEAGKYYDPELTVVFIDMIKNNEIVWEAKPSS